MDWLISAVFGWPAVISSLFASMIGVIKSRVIWLIAGCVIYFPFLWYLSMTPKFGFLAYLPLACLAGAALTVSKGWRRLSWVLIILVIIFNGYIAASVLFQ
ncbi:MAG: hypothetical protein PHT78_09805 [Desulfitobacteriaceae bacterium]|nr:hypothetical protein [Desulfitobacteriaceae bacterium]MDD4753521.1 hypothetical protein [Desulfitobacteriaceae bacterium]